VGGTRPGRQHPPLPRRPRPHRIVEIPAGRMIEAAPPPRIFGADLDPDLDPDFGAAGAPAIINAP